MGASILVVEQARLRARAWSMWAIRPWCASLKPGDAPLDRRFDGAVGKAKVGEAGGPGGRRRAHLAPRRGPCPEQARAATGVRDGRGPPAATATPGARRP